MTVLYCFQFQLSVRSDLSRRDTVALCLAACSSPPPVIHLQTLCCANTLHDQILQVTATAARLVDCMTQQLAAQWEPGAAGRITIAAANPTQASAGSSSWLQLAPQCSSAQGALHACPHANCY